MEEQDLKMATLRKIIYLLQEQGIVFERTESAILVDPFQEELLLESLIHFEERGRKSYPKPLKRCLGHHGLGHGKGKPDHRSGADRSPKFLGHDETSTPDF